MGKYTVLGLEGTDEKNKKYYLYLDVQDDYIYMTYRGAAVRFSRKDLDRIFIKEYKIRKEKQKNESKRIDRTITTI